MTADYLMNTASVLYFICYLPEFYANYENKNANVYNVFEKIVMLLACSFALQYAITIHNNALIINYAPTITLDIIALIMRSYYAYLNRKRNVKILYNVKDADYPQYNNTMNPIHSSISDTGITDGNIDDIL